jgi:hypothetical protein
MFDEPFENVTAFLIVVVIVFVSKGSLHDPRQQYARFYTGCSLSLSVDSSNTPYLPDVSQNL